MDFDRLCMGCMAEKGKAPICPYCNWKVTSKPISPHHFPPGTVLADRFLIGRVVYEDHCYVNYIAYDIEQQQKRIVKEFSPQSFFVRYYRQRSAKQQESVSLDFNLGLGRFIEEGMALQKNPPQPGSARVLEIIRTPETAYQVLEYIEGEHLSTFIEKDGGQISLNLIVKILMPVMEALQSFHENGLLHHDIHPDNILVQNNSEGCLINFNYTSYSLFQHVNKLPLILKPGFASPEFYQTDGFIGPWSDVYSLGAVIYAAITGRTPPDAISRMKRDTLARPSRLGKNIPLEIENALLKAMSVYPNTRYQTVSDFHATLFQHVIRKELEKSSRAWDAFTTVLCPRCASYNEALMIDLKVGTAFCSNCGSALITGIERTATAIDAFTTVVCPACNTNNEVLITDLETGTSQCLHCHSPLTTEQVAPQPESLPAESIPPPPSPEPSLSVPSEDVLQQEPGEDVASAAKETTPPQITEAEPPSRETSLEASQERTFPEETPPAVFPEAESPKKPPLPSAQPLTIVKCPSCGTNNELPPEAILAGAVCQNCHQPFITTPMPEGVRTSRDMVVEARKPVWIWLAAALILLSIGGVFGYRFYAKKVQQNRFFTRFVNEGDLSFRKHDYREAISYYQEALNYRSDDAYVLEQLRQSERYLNELQQRADTELSNKTHFSQLLSAADSLLDLKQFGAARDLYQQAQSIFPDTSIIRERLADVARAEEQQNRRRRQQTVPPPEPPRVVLKPTEIISDQIAAAKPNSIIHLASGIFKISSPLIIDKPLELRGEGAAQTLLVSDSASPIFAIRNGGKLTAVGIGMEHTGELGADIIRVEAGELLFRNCSLKGARIDKSTQKKGNGIHFLNKSSGVIQQCQLTGNYRALLFQDRSGGEVQDCDITDNTIGITIQHAAYPTLKNNRVQKNTTTAIWIFDKAHPHLEENVISENAENGIFLSGQGFNGNIRKNEISLNGELGIQLTEYSQPIIEENQVLSNEQGGIYFRDHSRGIVRKNFISRNKTGGIKIANFADPTIKENVVQDNLGDGIEILDKAKPTLERNEINRNNGDGVSLILTQSGGFIRGNKFGGNQGYGISILSSARPTLLNNVFKDNYEGHIYEEEP